MLQSTEYQVKPYLAWFWRTNNFSAVMRRRTLELTKAAKLLLLALSIGMAIEIIAGLILIYMGIAKDLTAGVPFGAALVLAYPIVWAHLAVVPLTLGRRLIAG